MIEKCPCQQCGVNIEFDAEYDRQFVTCPSCGNQTRLLLPSAKPAAPKPAPVPPPVLPPPSPPVAKDTAKKLHEHADQMVLVAKVICVIGVLSGFIGLEIGRAHV